MELAERCVKSLHLIMWEVKKNYTIQNEGSLIKHILEKRLVHSVNEAAVFSFLHF